VSSQGTEAVPDGPEAVTNGRAEAAASASEPAAAQSAPTRPQPTLPKRKPAVPQTAPAVPETAPAVPQPQPQSTPPQAAPSPDPAETRPQPVVPPVAPLSPGAPPARQPQARRPRYRHWWWLPGWLFAALTELPALLVLAWLIPGLALLLAGRFIAVPMYIMFPALAVALCYFVLRQLPVSWPRFREITKEVPPGPASRRPQVSVDALVTTLAIAAGFAIWQLAMNSEPLIVTRDPGTILQTAFWMAQHGTFSIGESLNAFGGAHAGMRFTGPGFFQVGSTLSPGLVPGLPAVLASGFWLGGTKAALILSPVIGACAVLAFAGLAGRLVGPRWAPAAALVLALSLPEQYTSRSAFAEPLAQILLFGGLSMVIDSMAVSARRHGIARVRGAAGLWHVWMLAGAGGLALGLAVVVEAGVLAALLPVLPFLGILFAGRRPQAIPLTIGLIAGTGYALACDYILSRPYMDSLGSSLPTLVLFAAGFAAVTVAGTVPMLIPAVRRGAGRVVGFSVSVRRTRRLRLATALTALASAVPVVALAAFLVRPYLQTVRGPVSAYVAQVQRLDALHVDGTRTYAEDSIYWVIWYLGVPALLLGVVGFAMLSRRCLRALLQWRDLGGAARIWALPLMMFGWSAVTVLYRPGIVPDQPYASRRLVPLVLPGLVIAAFWVLARLKVHAAALGAGRVTGIAVASCGVLALAIPPTVTTLGLSIGHRVSSTGVGVRRVGLGSVSAVTRLCGAIGSDASVVFVDPTSAEQFGQVVRGMCDIPAVRMDGATSAQVQEVVAAIQASGRHPVLLSAAESRLSGFGGSPREIADLSANADPHALLRPPSAMTPARYMLWMSAPNGVGAPTQNA
jgi:hypothetical protein